MNGPIHKLVIDTGTVAMVAGVIMKLLPILATLLPIIWWVIRIYETQTAQKMLRRLGWQKTDLPTTTTE